MLILLKKNFFLDFTQEKASSSNQVTKKFVNDFTSINKDIDDESGFSDASNITNNVDDPKAWHNTFKQKVQVRSPFFSMW